MNMTPKAEALKNLDFQAFQALMGIEKKQSFPSPEAFIQYLQEFDLRDILDVRSRCNCFFHEDARPSANIYTYQGRSLYKCFAESCPHRGKVLDLVGFYCVLRGCSNAQALQELARFFRADFPKTASLKDSNRILEILTKNREIVSLLPTEAPWAYEILGTDLTHWTPYIESQRKRRHCSSPHEPVFFWERAVSISPIIWKDRRVCRSHWRC